MLVICGPGIVDVFMVKGNAAPPPDVVKYTVLVPNTAELKIVDVAESDVELAVTFEKVRSGSVVDNVATERLVPVIVTVTLLPLAPLLGLTPETCGFPAPSELMRNLKFVVPPSAGNVTVAS